MNSCARRREAGLSFVELLVTIVIAGLAFGAMAPLALQAQKASSSDKMRNLALAIATERVENVRQQAYELILADKDDPSTTPNLYNPAFAGGVFGPTAKAMSGPGQSRTFQVDYQVTQVPSTAAWGSEKYKKVTVDVYWEGNPQPVKHVILSTFVYKQYAGPNVVSFSVSNLVYVPEDPIAGTDEHWYVSAQPITLSATIQPESVSTTSKVRFSVLANDGKEVFRRDVTRTPTLPDTYANGVFTTVWDPGEYRDGWYTFKTIAYAAVVGYQGEPWEINYQLETGAPAAPSGLTATPQSGSAKITWTPSEASDIDHYVLYRRLSTDADFPVTPLVDSVPVNMALTGYVDATVTTGSAYVYGLVPVDTSGNVGPAATASVTIGVVADTTKPSVPGGLVAAKVPSTRQVDLTWVASTDNIAVTGYKVYRATASGAVWPGEWTYLGDGAAAVSPSYTDSAVAWATTYYYRVLAFDAAGNWSDPSASSAGVTVDAAPPLPNWVVTIIVDNRSATHDLYVELVNSGTSVSYGAEKFRKDKTDTRTWTVPDGDYRTVVRWDNGTTGTEIPSKEQSFAVHGNVILNMVVP